MTRLLVTGGGGAGAPLLWRFWSPIYEVYFADCDPWSFSPEIPTHRCHIIAKAGEPGFADNLITVCRDLQIDLVVPAVDEELPVMPLLRRAGFDVLLPDEWYVHTMLDKLGSMRELEKRGIPVPRTVIGKPRWGRGSRDLMVEQEELQGQEYTVQMMADKNKNLVAVIPVRVDAKRGVTIRGVTDRDYRVVDACTAIHHALPAAGCYNIQGKLDGDSFRPFEINPRISTTTGMAIAAGFDPVAAWLGTYKSPLYSPTVSLSRSWLNTIRYT